METMDRKTAQEFLIGLTATKISNNESWMIAENLFLTALDKEIKYLKANNLPLSKIGKKEVLTVIYSLTRRKV